MSKSTFKKIFLSKWTLIVAIVLVIAAAGTVTALNWNNWFNSKPEQTVEKKVKTTVSKDIFWNIDVETYAFKSTDFSSSRAKDKEDDYYHITFSNISQQGRVVTRRAKDKSVVNKIDSMHVMGLVFDEQNIIVDCFPIEELGSEITVNKYFVEKYIPETDSYSMFSSDSLSGTPLTLSVPKEVPIYDFSGNVGELGMTIQQMVEGDCVYVISTKSGKMQSVLVVSRVVIKKVYWNLDRQYDSKTLATKRKPDAEGFYSFRLAVDGEQVTVKTSDLSIANRIDSTAACCFGLEFDKDGNINKFLPARNVTGGGPFASWYTVTSFENNILTASKGATTVSSELAKNCKIYDVSADRPNHIRGERVKTIGVGDVVHGLLNKKQLPVVIFIVTKAPDAVKKGYCEHCKQNVTWYEFTGSASDGRHYIMTSDRILEKQYTVGSVQTAAYLDKYIDGTLSTPDVVVDLNGHKLSSVKRAVVVGVGSKLTIMDSKKTGVITTENKDSHDTGIGMWVCLGGTCNFYGGTLDLTGISNTSQGTAISVSNGATFNQYGGTIKGGQTLAKKFISSSTGNEVKGGKYGGNVFLSAATTIQHSSTGKKLAVDGATYNMYGGEILDGFAQGTYEYDTSSGIAYSSSAYGGNVYISANAKFNMYNGLISGGKVKSLGDYREATGGNVFVVAKGKFTMYGGTVKDGVASDGGNFSVAKATTSLGLDVRGGQILNGRAEHLENDGKTTEGSKTNGWGGVGGNIYLNGLAECSNATISGGYANGSGGGGNVVVRGVGVFNLNSGVIKDGFVERTDNSTFGANISVTNASTAIANLKGGTVDGWVYLNKGILNMYDGAAISNANKADRRNLYICTGTTFNMYGGEIKDAIFSGTGGNIYNEGTMNMYGGTVKNGIAQPDAEKSGGHGGNIYNKGTINMSGGLIDSGIARANGGGNISSNGTSSKIIITGGEVKNGISPVTNRGNIYNWNKSTAVFSMSGGKVYADKEINDKNYDIGENKYYGGGVVVEAGTVTLSGDAVINGNIGKNLSLASGVVATVTKLKDGADISLYASGTFGTVPEGEKAEDYVKYFTCEVAGKTVKSTNDNKLKCSGHEHCECNATAKGVGDHTKCDDTITWEPLTADMLDLTKDDCVIKQNATNNQLTFKTANAHYYLAEDISIDTAEAPIRLKDGSGTPYASSPDLEIIAGVNSTKSLSICLNGHTLNFGGIRIAAWSNTNGTAIFNLTDCATGGKIITSNNAVCISTGKNNAVNQFGGEIISTGTSAVDIRYGTYNLYGGTISVAKDCTAPTVICKNAKDAGLAKFVMHGGIVNAGKSNAIRIAPSTDNASPFHCILNGGTVNGGGDSAIYISGGSSTTTKNYAKLEVNKDIVINGGTAENGAAINHNFGNIIFKGGKVNKGTVTGEGDAVYINGNLVEFSGTTEIDGEIYIATYASASCAVKTGINPASPYKIKMQTPGVFSSATSTTQKSHFTSVDDKYQVKYQSSKLKLAAK